MKLDTNAAETLRVSLENGAVGQMGKWGKWGHGAMGPWGSLARWVVAKKTKENAPIHENGYLLRFYYHSNIIILQISKRPTSQTTVQSVVENDTSCYPDSHRDGYDTVQFVLYQFSRYSPRC